MKKFKKVWALTMASVLCAGMLAGCGGGGQSSAGKENNADTGESINADSGETYEIVVELMTYGMSPKDIEMVESAVNEITVPEINATVKFLPVTVADHATKVGLLTAGGEKVDLIMTGITSSPSNLYSNGVLTDIKDLLDEYAPELVEMEGELLKVGTFDGGIYSVPGKLYPGEKLMMLYNKSMAEEYNIDVPEALNGYDDWDAFFEQVQSKLPENVYAFTLGDGSGASTLNWDSQYDTFGDSSYLSYGVITDVENGTEITNWYEGDKYKTMLEKRREWYEKGYCVPDSMTSGYTTLDCMSAGTCFAFQNGFGADCNEVTLSKSTGVELGYIQLSESVISGSSTAMMSWGVPVTSEKPEKAVQLLNLMFTNTDLMNLLNYGIEGTHYEKVSDRIIDYPEGVDVTNCGWGGFINWFGDNAKAYQFAPMTEAYYDELESYGMEKSKVSNALGYSFDSSSVKTQLAGITSVIDTNKPSLECGLVDVNEKLPQFIEGLKGAGIDDVIAANQEQYTKWLSEK